MWSSLRLPSSSPVRIAPCQHALRSYSSQTSGTTRHPLGQDQTAVDPRRSFILRNGVEVPAVSLVLGAGFGPDTTRRVIKSAVRSGYRGFDLCNGHVGEELVGEAFAELMNNGEVAREDLWITTKLWNTNHRFVTQALKTTLDKLGLEYVDSYLIGWPQACPSTGVHPTHSEAVIAYYTENTMFPVDDDGLFCSDEDSHFVDTWHRMEKMADQGRARVIGLCNFNRDQVAEVFREAYVHPPSILQTERHPYLQIPQLVDYCKEKEILIQATVPVGGFDQVLGGELGQLKEDAEEACEHPLIRELAEKHQCSPNQLILRWHLQSGVAVCPRTITDDEIRQNIDLWRPEMQLDQAEMDELGKLDRSWRHLLWPETSLHPDYPFRDELPRGYKAGKPKAPPMRSTFSHHHNSEAGKYGHDKFQKFFE